MPTRHVRAWIGCALTVASSASAQRATLELPGTPIGLHRIDDQQLMVSMQDGRQFVVDTSVASALLPTARIDLHERPQGVRIASLPGMQRMLLGYTGCSMSPHGIELFDTSQLALGAQPQALATQRASVWSGLSVVPRGGRTYVFAAQAPVLQYYSHDVAGGFQVFELVDGLHAMDTLVVHHQELTVGRHGIAFDVHGDTLTQFQYVWGQSPTTGCWERSRELAVYDVSVPAAPQLVSTTPFPIQRWYHNDIDVVRDRHGNLLASLGADGLALIRVDDPHHPVTFPLVPPSPELSTVVRGIANVPNTDVHIVWGTLAPPFHWQQSWIGILRSEGPGRIVPLSFTWARSLFAGRERNQLDLLVERNALYVLAYDLQRDVALLQRW